MPGTWKGPMALFGAEARAGRRGVSVRPPPRSWACVALAPPFWAWVTASLHPSCGSPSSPQIQAGSTRSSHASCSRPQEALGAAERESLRRRQRARGLLRVEDPGNRALSSTSSGGPEAGGALQEQRC